MEKERYRLIISVKEIHGKCPVFKVGDKIVIEEPMIAVRKTDNLCIHAFGSILSMIIPLSRGISFRELGLAKGEDEKGFFQCLDIRQEYIHTQIRLE